MLKRKYGNRPDWQRIITRKSATAIEDTDRFRGDLTLLHAVKVTAPASFTYGEKEICIIDDGYTWLQQFPADANHSVTTMFDADGNVVQWYIDICLSNGKDEQGPWMDDLFLDLILLPGGELIVKDADELDEALDNQVIDQKLYDLAWKEAETLIDLIKKERFEPVRLSYYHKDKLEKTFR
ncbi:DUF402 domain-containing protein [Jeotgalibacillus terrae]|uniref:DUF402 domain-containing protein n=1 Tax=Jeotgalibacillus terrae TaxID=587735 RepID=A0ABW5ZH74_9BACL|nr:DUF402 domain-containing protein [Jeotgalibacillus terrae]MBM7578638.1 putative RNA-binding protein associated with RNAse of E/G family [Jeotgalibacillus terrae]